MRNLEDIPIDLTHARIIVDDSEAKAFLAAEGITTPPRSVGDQQTRTRFATLSTSGDARTMDT